MFFHFTEGKCSRIFFYKNKNNFSTWGNFLLLITQTQSNWKQQAESYHYIIDSKFSTNSFLKLKKIFFPSTVIINSIKNTCFKESNVVDVKEVFAVGKRKTLIGHWFKRFFIFYGIFFQTFPHVNLISKTCFSQRNPLRTK